MTQLAVLTSPEQNLSVEVYSAANSNADSVPIQIMSLDPSGRFFGRRLQGTADFDDQTVSGGLVILELKMEVLLLRIL